MKSEKEKQSLLDQLKRVPIIQIACDKTSVSRATLYRWKVEDKEFAKKIDEAIYEGRSFINDMSESQVISMAKEKNWSAVSFWLKHHHPEYMEKSDLINRARRKDQDLSEQQQITMGEALKFILEPFKSKKRKVKILKHEPSENEEFKKKQAKESEEWNNKIKEAVKNSRRFVNR